MNEETDSAPPSMGVTKLMSTDNREEKKLLQRPGSLARYTEAELGLLGGWTHENFFDKALILTPSALMLAYNLYSATQTLSPVSLALGAAIGFLAADESSGVVHAIGDASTDDKVCGNPSLATRITLTMFPASFMHHEYPQNLTLMTYWEKTRGYNICLIPVLVGASLLGGVPGYALTIGGVFLANCEVFHSISHGQYKDKTLVKAAKNEKIILDEAHHRVHHYGNEYKGIEPFTQNFCLIQGHIMDKVLNPIFNFFRKWCGARVGLQKDD